MKTFLVLAINATIFSDSAMAHQLVTINQHNVVGVLASHFYSYFLLGVLTYALCQFTNFQGFVLLNLILVITLSKHGQELLGSGDFMSIITWLSGTIATIWVGNKTAITAHGLIFELIMSKRPGKEKNYAKEK